jgi:hypothetical protein
MNRFEAILSKALLLALPLGVATVAGAPRDAQAQIVVAPPPPPAGYIATYQPEYYEGRPVYLYNGRWFYRDVHGWNYYRTEPWYLHGRRAHWAERGRWRYHYHR